MSTVVMPKLVEHMEEALVSRWLFADGDQISLGDELVEVETDKATTALEAEFAGTLRILAAEGTMVAVGAPLAEVVTGEVPAPAAAPSEEPPPPQPAGSDQPTVDAPPPAPAVAPPAAAAPVQPISNGRGRVIASPLARRIAKEHGLDLQTLPSESASGRILKRDVLQALEAAPVATPAVSEAAAVAPAAPAPGTGVATSQEITRTQLLIARRMAESTSTIPDFSVAIDVDMSACVQLRGELKLAAGDAGVAPSYNDMVVKAVALALREFPRANGSYRDGRFELHSRVNVGVAVAAEDSLVVPTVFDADVASLGTIARATRELAEKVREGTISAPDLAGGTFTVSNLGMYGVRQFSAVINPPQAAILAVGGIEERAVVRDGELCARAMMTANLVSDHRILYGADAAQFLSRVRDLLESPLAMAL